MLFFALFKIPLLGTQTYNILESTCNTIVSIVG